MLRPDVKWQRWQVFAAAGAVAIAGYVGFEKCGRSAAPPLEAGAKAEALPAAPVDLLADITVATPNPSWKKLQAGIGGAAGLLPVTLPGLLITQTDLDMNLAAELDGSSPMYGVIAGDLNDPGIAVAVKLVDARRTKSVLADGEGAKFVAKDAGAVTVLAPARAGAAHKFELAITPNGYLLVTRRAEDVATLGPYVTRTLPARPLPDVSAVVDIPRSAIAGKIKPWLEGMWKEGKSFLLAEDARMREAKGRAPDYGDPAAIVAALDGILVHRIAVIGDLEKLRLSLDVVDDAVIFASALTPGSDPAGPARAWISEMKVGDPAPVLGMPSTAAVAIGTRESEPERAEQAASLEKNIVTLLGPRLTEPAMLHDLFGAVTKARDESAAMALGIDEPTGLFVRAPVRNAEAAERVLRDAVELAKVDPFKKLLHVKEVKSTSEEVPGLGKAAVATLVRSEKNEKGKPQLPPLRHMGLAWTIDHDVLSLGVGPEPVVTFKLGAKPDKKLADEPALKRFLTAIGNDASTVIVAQPLRLDMKRANLPIAPVGIAIGRKGSDGMVRVEIADGILHELARRELGF
jgi:hypothetical protein